MAACIIITEVANNNYYTVTCTLSMHVIEKRLTMQYYIGTTNSQSADRDRSPCSYRYTLNGELLNVLYRHI